MKALRRFMNRLTASVLRQRDDDRLREELAEHMALQTEQYVRSGLPPDEARRQARLKLGPFDAITEAYRDEQRLPSIEDVLQDMRYAVRTLRRRPTFALAAILTLALGIGSNAAIFTIVNAILLRPLPLPHSEQLQAVYTQFLPTSGLDFPYFELSGPELADIRSRVTAYSGVAGYAISDRTLAHDKGAVERVSTLQVTSGFFDILGVGPVRGRTFTEEEAPSGARLAVLSEDAGATDSIGSTIRLDDVPCEVIGVMPKALASVSAGVNPGGSGVRADRITVWTPLSVAEDTLNN